MRRLRHARLLQKLHPSASGGQLRNFRKGRGARRISVRFSMHLVLRSVMARGAWSFAKKNNRQMIQHILEKHAAKSGLQLLSVGNAGNHLHLKIKAQSKDSYFHFIRAVTGEIALKIKKIPRADIVNITKNFWSSRPFSSIVSSFSYARRLMEYIRINQLEGMGFTRHHARFQVAWERNESAVGARLVAPP